MKKCIWKFTVHDIEKCKGSMLEVIRFRDEYAKIYPQDMPFSCTFMEVYEDEEE